MAKISKKEQQKAILQERTEKALAEMRDIFSLITDGERQELHRKLMKGYCSTCAHTYKDTCWNCFESGCDISW